MGQTSRREAASGLERRLLDDLGVLAALDVREDAGHVVHP
jgi:hypothetical protein